MTIEFLVSISESPQQDTVDFQHQLHCIKGYLVSCGVLFLSMPVSMVLDVSLLGGVRLS